MSAAAVEEILQQRLLLNERAINSAIKDFHKFCFASDSDDAALAKMKSTIRAMAFATTRTALADDANREEIKSYTATLSSIEQQIAQTEEAIVAERGLLDTEKKHRANREEYHALACAIDKVTPRAESNSQLETLKGEIDALIQDRARVQGLIELRKKQFHVLLHTAMELMSELEEEAEAHDEETVAVAAEDTADSTRSPMDTS